MLLLLVIFLFLIAVLVVFVESSEVVFIHNGVPEELRIFAESEAYVVLRGCGAIHLARSRIFLAKRHFISQVTPSRRVAHHRGNLQCPTTAVIL